MTTGLSSRRIWAIAKRHALALRRSPHRFFDITIWPLVDVVLFGSIGAFVAGGDNGEVAFAYLLSGVVLWHVIYQAQISLATGFLEETWTRNLLNLLVTPLKEIEYVAGVVLFGFVKLAFGVGLAALAALGFFAFGITDVGWALVPIVAVLLVVGWVIAFFVIGLVLRFGSGAEALVWGILFGIMPLSGVFYPPDALPGVLQPIAVVLPTTHAFAAGRAVIDGAGMPWGLLGLAALSSVIALTLAVVFLTRMLRLFRDRGYVGRYS